MGGLLLAEVSTITMPANWFDSIVSVCTANAPLLLGGFVAILAITAGFGWIMKNSRKAVKG